MLFEQGIEIIGVIYTNLFAYFVDRKIGFLQHFGCRRHSDSAQIIIKGKSCAGAEYFSEVGGGESYPFGEHSKRYIGVGIMLVYIVFNVKDKSLVVILVFL